MPLSGYQIEPGPLRAGLRQVREVPGKRCRRETAGRRSPRAATGPCHTKARQLATTAAMMPAAVPQPSDAT